MTRENLLGLYQTKLNHITLTYASMILWCYPDTPRAYLELYEQMRPKLPSKPGVLLDAEPLINNEEALRIATNELYESAHRAAIKELFPLTKLYCNSTGQLDLMKAQSWFEFWRIIRNCWSHDMTFNFNTHEKAVLPVTWSGVTLEISMNGKHLTHGLCSREKLRELLWAARGFVLNDLA